MIKCVLCTRILHRKFMITFCDFALQDIDWLRTYLPDHAGLELSKVNCFLSG